MGHRHPCASGVFVRVVRAGLPRNTTEAQISASTRDLLEFARNETGASEADLQELVSGFSTFLLDVLQQFGSLPGGRGPGALPPQSMHRCACCRDRRGCALILGSVLLGTFF